MPSIPHHRRVDGEANEACVAFFYEDRQAKIQCCSSPHSLRRLRSGRRCVHARALGHETLAAVGLAVVGFFAWSGKGLGASRAKTSNVNEAHIGGQSRTQRLGLMSTVTARVSLTPRQRKQQRLSDDIEVKVGRNDQAWKHRGVEHRAPRNKVTSQQRNGGVR